MNQSTKKTSNSIPTFLIAKYDSVDLIDQGAHGGVFKCVLGENTTAVKVLGSSDPVLGSRFQREIDILRKIDHPHVIKFLDMGVTDAWYWHETEYADQGHFGTLHSYLFFSDLDRVKYFRQICLGVEALHAAAPPIIHRDLKPRNILAFEVKVPDREIVLKVADFGIAAIVGDDERVTTAGTFLGTPDYMAPERKKDPRIRTPASDIYSLGITFLEACTGYTTPSLENLALVPDVLRPMIEKMVRQRPNDRYVSVAAILKDLNGFSSFRLLHGRDPIPGETGTHIAHVNIGRELENAWELLLKGDPSNVIDRLRALEIKLDRLGDARDHEADQIMRIRGPILATIEGANPCDLLQLVQRFLSASEGITPRNHFQPAPDMWAEFLYDVFQRSSYRPTKELALEGLARCLVRFGTGWTKNVLYQTVLSTDDASYMRHLAVCLREVGNHTIPELLDGVPDDKELNEPLLRAVLSDLPEVWQLESDVD